MRAVCPVAIDATGHTALIVYPSQILIVRS